MIRFNFYIPEDMLAGLEHRAKQDNVSTALIIRRAVSQYLSGAISATLCFENGIICSGTIAYFKMG